MFTNAPCRVVLVMMLSALLLAGCTSSEDKAQSEFTRIETIEKTGDADQALRLYAALAEKYPDTPAGKKAMAASARLTAGLEARIRDHLTQPVERLRLTLNGYSSMFGKLPTSTQELDGSGYFFDSKYLGEIVPNGSTVYMLLDGKDRTQFWSLEQGIDAAYTGGMNGDLQRITRDAAEKDLAGRYREVERLGNLVVVTLR